MKKYILALFFLTAFISTYSQTRTERNNIVGTWKYFVGFFECTLVLNSDNTYTYSRVGDLSNNKTEGNWKLQKSILVLNSYKQKPDESQVISHFIDSITGVRISIRDIFGYPVFHPDVKIFNDRKIVDTLILNISGLFEFPNIDNIRSLEVSFLGLKTASWMGTLNHNFFEIIMEPEYQDYIYQINEKWKIRKDRLYHPDYKKDNRMLNNRKRVNYFVKIKN
jgi:hypothetical protein